MKWEYKIENLSLENTSRGTDRLNSLGLEGWELVQVQGNASGENGNRPQAILKRAISN
jgi:hypothetical protein